MTGASDKSDRAVVNGANELSPPLRASVPSAGALAPCPYCSGAFKMGQEPRDNHPVSGLFYIFHARETDEARQCRIEVCGHFESAEAAIAYWNPTANAQANLVRMAQHERERRRDAEDAFELISPWVAKFVAAVDHYNRTPPRYQGSTFLADPDPGYNPVLSVSVNGCCPFNSPTVSDLRFMADAYAQAIEARRAATGTGAVHESAVRQDAPEPSTQTHTTKKKGE